MNGLGWGLADEVMGMREQVELVTAEIQALRWWQWRKRRSLRRWRGRLLAGVGQLEAKAEAAGLDVGVLFGKRPRLRLGPRGASSGHDR